VLAKGPNLHEPMNALSGRFAAISETEFETEYRDHWMLAAHPDSQPLNRHVSPQLSISSFDDAALGAARRFERPLAPDAADGRHVPLGVKIALTPIFFAVGVWIAWRSLVYAGERNDLTSLVLGALGMAVGVGGGAGLVVLIIR